MLRCHHCFVAQRPVIFHFFDRRLFIATFPQPVTCLISPLTPSDPSLSDLQSRLTRPCTFSGHTQGVTLEHTTAKMLSYPISGGKMLCLLVLLQAAAGSLAFSAIPQTPWTRAQTAKATVNSNIYSHACYAMPFTDTAHSHPRLQESLTVCSEAKAGAPPCSAPPWQAPVCGTWSRLRWCGILRRYAVYLRASYAMPGTNVAC